MEQDNSRNTIIFVVCAVAILLAYQFFVLGPSQQRREAEERARAAATATQAPAGPGVPGVTAGTQFVDRAQALAQSPRVQIDTPALRGSISLRGGRIDDLFLRDYRQTIAKDSPPVELFRPEGARNAYFAQVGWTGQAPAPGPDTTWTLTTPGELTPDHPVSMTWDNGQGLTFTRTVAVDDTYMFTVTDQVANHGGAPVQLAPYATVQRQGLPADLSASMILHEGAVGMLGGKLQLFKFKDWKKKGLQTEPSTGGWVGVTDKYWLAAAIPQQQENIQGSFRVSTVGDVDVYEANFVGGAQTIAPGATAAQTTRVFAGAKKVSVLQAYQKDLGIPRLDQAVDWGNFWFFTRPIFWLLETYHKAVPNFGLSILLLTVTVRLAFFPLANKSYESMSKMKKLQPQMEEIKKRNEKDPAKQQQEVMAMYQREKVNPLSGCLPMLIQIPVFYSLYKVLYVTLEMRHAPFFGWIRDLSAPDPTTMFNLFGLIPYDPSAVPVIGSILAGPLHIGVLPLVYGLTMWLTTSMSPSPSTDPTQKLIFQLFPLIFTFTMAHFPAGLLVYWSFSNLLTIVQQYVIMRRLKVDNPIDAAIARLSGKAATAKG